MITRTGTAAAVSYDSVLRHQGIAAAASMWHDEPPRSSDSRLDAAFAALAEHLARRDGWAVPAP